jgi:hypothetical protein
MAKRGPPARQLAYEIARAAEKAGVSRAQFWRDMKRGLISTIELDGRRVITSEALFAYMTAPREQGRLHGGDVAKP